MINSRSLDDLHPTVRAMAEDLKARCAAENIDILITSTYRDNESQDALYAQGRTAPGNKVTNAKVPLRGGKPVWNTSGVDGQLWMRVGAMCKAAGLEWAGDWTSFKEYPHFQFTNGLKLSDFEAGKTLDS